ncbi:MAG: hypothetical protein IJ867_03915 [Clostridia bacterium]|nr:hypothetical protein [Clostridia bacterium]
MNKRKKILLVVAVLMLVLLVAMVLGYTYAKYTNSKSVSGELTQAATWKFDGAIATANGEATTSISLAPTVNKDSIVTGKIAPGTSGSFKIIINAKGSEVDMDYDVLLKGEENTKPANLYFTCEDLVDENNELIKYYSLTDMLAVDSATGRSNLHGTIDKDENNNAKEIIVNWDWPYESEARDGKSLADLDDQDTKDSGIKDYTFTLSIVGSQKNPNAQ